MPSSTAMPESAAKDDAPMLAQRRAHCMPAVVHSIHTSTIAATQRTDGRSRDLETRHALLSAQAVVPGFRIGRLELRNLVDMFQGLQ